MLSLAAIRFWSKAQRREPCHYPLMELKARIVIRVQLTSINMTLVPNRQKLNRVVALWHCHISLDKSHSGILTRVLVYRFTQPDRLACLIQFAYCLQLWSPCHCGHEAWMHNCCCAIF